MSGGKKVADGMSEIDNILIEKLREENAALKRENEALRARLDGSESQRTRFRDALQVIAEDDDLVKANEGAFSVHALKRVKEIAKAALSRPSSDKAGK